MVTTLVRLVMDPEDLEELRMFLSSEKLSNTEVRPLHQTTPTVLGQPWLEALILSCGGPTAIIAVSKTIQTWLKERGKTERLKLWIIHEKHEEQLNSLHELEAFATENPLDHMTDESKSKPTTARPNKPRSKKKRPKTPRAKGS
jgi:hypothetical protein